MTNVFTAKGRKISSTRWLQRHINDEYVKKASLSGYCSRAAFKLIDIDDKYNILRNIKVARVNKEILHRPTIIDLGCAPGSWLQVICERVSHKSAHIIGLDINAIRNVSPPDDRVLLIDGDFTDDNTITNIIKSTTLNDSMVCSCENYRANIDVILSDMAPTSCGGRDADRFRIMSLIEAAAEFALQHLRNGGSFVTKILQGGWEKEFFNRMKRHFSYVKFFKPKASYSDSSEIYIVCINYIINGE